METGKQMITGLMVKANKVDYSFFWIFLICFLRHVLFYFYIQAFPVFIFVCFWFYILHSTSLESQSLFGEL